ncbi:MAG TPA: cellulase family glycosylhydrolase, partial [Candidatus Dormibacteraeota bacterium]|nr:cellulase family glycosylhydrolase [Candidatus Dormibacteraeota bacterium]
YGGAGAPVWAQFSSIPNTPSWIHQDVLRKNLSPGANAATTYFWAFADWQADYMGAWQAVAQRLAGLSGVAGYDLYNEPRPGPIPPPLFEKYFMWPLMSRTIEAIGKIDPNHLFIVEATLFADLPTWVEPLNTPNVVYSPHFYTGTLVPPQFNGDASAIKKEMADRVREAGQMGVPLWFGEIGGSHNAPLATTWADLVLDAADQNGAGWAWWQWRQQGTDWNIRSLDGATYNLDFLRHVARPYLAIAPLGVQGGNGDGVNGALTVVVAPTHDGGRAEVAWPTLTQSVPTAFGSCLRASSWDAAVSRLILEFKPGQGCKVQIQAS